MTPQPSSFFVDRRGVTPDIHLDLFRGFFEHTAFTSWHGREGTWQLQITGGPGSGKTALSAVIVEHLRREYNVDDCRTASVFFQGCTLLGTHTCVKEVLDSVLRQLSDGPFATVNPHSNCPDLQDTRANLLNRVGTLRRSFLVLDDLDLCSLPLVHALENELAVLQQYGLKVMTTSRIPLHFSDREIICDVGYPDAAEVVSVYWCCTTCNPPGDTFNWEGAYYICERHRQSGHRCPNDKDHMLYEPYERVNLLMNTILQQSPAAFANLILEELRMAHGDLTLPITTSEPSSMSEREYRPGNGVRAAIVGGLDVDKHQDSVSEDDPPPFSKLGLELKDVPERVEELIGDILDEAAFNISIVKLRTDIYQAAQTMDDLDRVRDRLPEAILATFDAAVERVVRQPSSESRLGLVAINLVCFAPESVPFSDLARSLRAKRVVGNETDESSATLQDRAIRATCGLLTVFPKEDAPVDPYTHLFRLYVAESYNDDLARVNDTYGSTLLEV